MEKTFEELLRDFVLSIINITSKLQAMQWILKEMNDKSEIT